MNLPELIAILRCLDCGGPLHGDEAGLACPGCGRAYRVVEGIPIMMDEDPEAEVWKGYFQKLAGARGDSEAANSYFNLRSFRIVRVNLLKLIGKPSGMAILDIGCGTGHFSQSLAEGNRLVGADISLEMASYARMKGLATVQSSGRRLPFGPGSFALVIANNVIQSFRDGGPFVREAARVLRPGGRLVLSATNGQNLAMAVFRRLEREKYRHLGVYSAAALRRLVGEAGLEATSLLFFYFPTGKVSETRGNARVGRLRNRLAATVAVEAVKPVLCKNPAPFL